ncbi:hypothetical protein P692DRAFT_20878405 [Suillus brevipes Sb2]|nr:hypothetical protein P692DRAFT_20878405 [Suillus brevipes Sb2]
MDTGKQHCQRALAHWALRQQCLENLRQQEEQEEGNRLQLAKDEEEAARLEERKKNKNKYAPVKRVKIPSDPSIIPAAYAVRKLKAGEFCELHYFTNRGLDDAVAVGFGLVWSVWFGQGLRRL